MLIIIIIVFLETITYEMFDPTFKGFFFQDYYEANDGNFVFLELLESSKLELLFSLHYKSRNGQS